MHLFNFIRNEILDISSGGDIELCKKILYNVCDVYFVFRDWATISTSKMFK